MSGSLSPLSTSGYASPASIQSPLLPSVSTTKPSTKPKPANVFSNDGSFLERFQRLKREEDEKKKREEELARKREFDNRFKNRGKRHHSGSSTASSPAPEDPPLKKHKSDKPLTEYEKQLKNFDVPSLKDNGVGVRPLVK